LKQCEEYAVRGNVNRVVEMMEEMEFLCRTHPILGPFSATLSTSLSADAAIDTGDRDMWEYRELGLDDVLSQQA
jgi:hypothetical protein